MSQIITLQVEDKWTVDDIVAEAKYTPGVKVLSTIDLDSPPIRMDWNRGIYEEDSLETLS